MHLLLSLLFVCLIPHCLLRIILSVSTTFSSLCRSASQTRHGLIRESHRTKCLTNGPKRSKLFRRRSTTPFALTAAEPWVLSISHTRALCNATRIATLRLRLTEGSKDVMSLLLAGSKHGRTKDGHWTRCLCMCHVWPTAVSIPCCSTCYPCSCSPHWPQRVRHPSPPPCTMPCAAAHASQCCPAPAAAVTYSTV